MTTTSRRKKSGEQAAPHGGKWKRQDRTIVKGDVLRTKVGNKQNPHYGEYAYGVADGYGNGCRLDSLGSAIFVRWETFDFEETFKHRNDPEPEPEPDTADCGDPNCESAKKGTVHGHIKMFPEGPADVHRWESFWGVEYLDGVG